MPAPDPEEFHAAVQDRIDDPYPVYARYREAAPLHRVRRPGTGREPEWLVLGHATASRVLSSRNFGRRAGVAAGTAAPVIPADHPTLSALVENWMVFMDPPRHFAVRSTVAEWFSRCGRDGLADKVTAMVTDLVATLAERDRVELVAECSAVVPMFAVLEMLGAPAEDRTWLREQVLALQEASTFRPGSRAERLARSEQAATELSAYFGEMVGRRRADGVTDDLLGTLREQGWADDLVVATAVHLLASGHETTRNTLSKLALALSRDEQLRSRIVAEPRVAGLALDELLRHDPPAQLLSRWVYKDTSIGHRWLQRGDKVSVVVGSANRDPAAFADADRIVIDRQERRHLAFGLGGHYCVGSSLARVIGEAAVVALAAMTGRFRVDPRRRGGVVT